MLATTVDKIIKNYHRKGKFKLTKLVGGCKSSHFE